MNTQKYTPGPWRVDLNEYDNEYRVYEDGGDRVAPIINSLFKPFGEVGLANARLIAAAPDLLEACKAAEYITPKELREQPWFIRMRATIAKAEGRS